MLTTSLSTWFREQFTHSLIPNMRQITHCTVHIVQHLVYSTYFTLPIVQYIFYNTQRTVYIVEYPVYIEHALYSIVKMVQVRPQVSSGSM